MKKGAMRSKRAQVTIFIIVGIIIVAAGFLIYSFYPQIKSTLGGEEKNPPAYIQSCLEDKIKDTVDKLSLQGGSLNPESYIVFYGSKVEYLCYTSEYYRNCIVQQPLIKRHIESEIKTEIQSDVERCFNLMKESYDKKGYTTELTPGEQRVELFPNRVVATFNYSLSLTKGDTQKYDSFSVIVNNDIYELVGIASSVIEWETTYGDADVATLMIYYHDLKAEKELRESGEKIYILTNRDTGDKFQFAVRSQAWPAGYAKPII